MVDATDQPLMIWKTLAISEHLSERFLAHPIWPNDPDLRAPARSLGAEMQCSFAAPRNHCRMHIGINLSHRGRILWRDTPAVQANIGANSRSAPHFYLDPTGRIWPARLAKLMFFLRPLSCSEIFMSCQPWAFCKTISTRSAPIQRGQTGGFKPCRRLK